MMQKQAENGVQLLCAEEKDAEMIRAMQQLAFAELLERYQDYDMSPATESLEKITWKISHPGSYNYFILAGDQTVRIRYPEKEQGICFVILIDTNATAAPSRDSRGVWYIEKSCVLCDFAKTP